MTDCSRRSACPMTSSRTSGAAQTLSVLQKVKDDTQIFINLFINVLFSSFVGIAFLIAYSVTKNLAAGTGFCDRDSRARIAHRVA